MDCNMPIMDGFEASQKILKYITKYDSKKLPYIITLTAYNTEEIRRKSMESGMQDFLTKPVNSESLEEILKKFNLV